MTLRTLTIFVGPSLRPADHQALHARIERRGDGDVRVDVRPPVRRGDLIDVVEGGQEADLVLVIDGEFGQELSLSVLEIREAITSGLLVLGAGSMGAMRAAECDVLGMLGFGWVFRGFRSGWLRSDAEVALLFDPLSYQPITLPLVNVRWVVRVLERQGTLGPEAGVDAVHGAATVNFRERTFDELDRIWRRSALLPDDARQTLLELLDPAGPGEHDRKRLDALEALAVAERLADPRRQRPLTGAVLRP